MWEKFKKWIMTPSIEDYEYSTKKVDEKHTSEYEGKYDGYKKMVEIHKQELYDKDLKKKEMLTISINDVKMIKYNIKIGA